MAFRLSCYKGYIDMAKWLYGLDGKINIHVDNDYAFFQSCYSGKLEVVKWLYGLDGKINIHVDNDDAFRISCENGYMDVTIWLYGLDKEYYNKWIRYNKIENDILMDKIMKMRMKESKLDIDDRVEISI